MSPLPVPPLKPCPPQNLTDAISYEGGEEEKNARIFCKQLGIGYDKLEQDEFVTLIGILKKSEHRKSPYSKRGKASPQ